MTELWRRLAELPGAVRWSLLGAGGLVLAAFAVSGVWTWNRHREASAQHALAPVVATAHGGLTADQPGALDEAARQLNQFLKEHPRSRAATQAWYLLGDVEFRRGQWDAAQAAFAEVLRRDGESLGRLSRLGQGYIFEAKGEMARAAEVYQQALTGLGPRDFLYGELLLAKARAQEQAKDTASAVATYRQYLKELPSSDRADEVRVRLGLLGGTS